ncbi:MAG: hypothetical protein OEY77_00120 [Nitrospira sp.]|nr:hypothetical protein [Nitrospira sp.]
MDESAFGFPKNLHDRLMEIHLAHQAAMEEIERRYAGRLQELERLRNVPASTLIEIEDLERMWNAPTMEEL